MDNANGNRSGQGRLIAYDDLRQIVRDLLAPVYERLDNLRDEVAELKRRPQDDANNRSRDVLMICTIIGAIVALTTCGSSVLYTVITVWLHYAR